jgi:hypothetical protein
MVTEASIDLEGADLSDRSRALYHLGGNDLGILSIGAHNGGLVMLLEAGVPDDFKALLSGLDSRIKLVDVADYQLLEHERELLDKTASRVVEGQDYQDLEQRMQQSVAYFARAAEEGGANNMVGKGIAWIFDPEASDAFQKVASMMEADDEWGENDD